MLMKFDVHVKIAKLAELIGWLGRLRKHRSKPSACNIIMFHTCYLILITHVPQGDLQKRIKEIFKDCKIEQPEPILIS